jgi:ribonuclease HII
MHYSEPTLFDTATPDEGASHTPSLALEQDLWNSGYLLVAGVDEAGRGCLAGPVVAAAVIMPRDIEIEGVQDSKSLSVARRETMVEIIRREAVAVGIGICSPAEIDRLNILWAAMEAMRRALAQLEISPEYALVDGNTRIPEVFCPHRPIVRGDAISQTIAAASIVAKTHRDALMRTLHETCPAYDWKQNKGYPTRAHYEALAAHGPTPYHRKSFRLTRRGA